MTESLTLALRRPEKPGGVEHVTVTWNGNVQMTEGRGEPMPVHSYLFELDGDQRAARLAQLRERLG